MSVLINFKICDNAKECGGIAICPTKAIYWNEKNNKIGIDNSKCINCFKCEPSCPISAIKVAKNEEEYKKIKKEFKEDPRKVSDLFIDRYGAQTIQKVFLIPEGKFKLEVLESAKLTAVEFFNDASIMCLLGSIPIKDLFEGLNLKYRRFYAKEDSLLKKYNIKELPALLFFKNGKLLGKIEGYFDTKKKETVKKKIKEIIS